MIGFSIHADLIHVKNRTWKEENGGPTQGEGFHIPLVAVKYQRSENCEKLRNQSNHKHMKLHK